jgi:hypothetical protein
LLLEVGVKDSCMVFYQLYGFLWVFGIEIVEILNKLLRVRL